MTKEQKDLLLKDLYARLPHRIKVDTIDNDGSMKKVFDILWYNAFTEDVKLINYERDADKIVDISEVKPYLFPLSSMTEEQEKEYLYTCNGYCTYYWTEETFDWLNENHFDYRGLIEKGLAIDATGLNIY
jgi:hypothetical protein